MARDYSSRAGNNKSKKRKKKPAARRKSRGSIPGWIWLLCGLCLGVIVAAVVFIATAPSGTPGLSVEIANGHGQQAQKQKPSAGKSKGKTTQQENPKKPRFAFYSMLPNYEVVVPQQEYKDKHEHATSQASTPKVETPGKYVIQAGSFSTFADADRRKAGLALLGVESKISKGKLKSGKAIYRVRSTPIKDLDRLNAVLKKLHDKHIETLVMRRKS